MDWLIFAILAPVIYTVVNFTDKYVAGRAIPDARAVPVFLAIVHATMGTVFWAINDFRGLPFSVAAPLMLTGALTIVGTFMLYRALVVEETSKIVMWAQMLPVVVLVLSVLILDERLTVPQLLGFALVFAATLGLSFEPGSLRPTAAFWFIMVAVAVWASSDIVFKLTLNAHPALTGQLEGSVDAVAFLMVIGHQSWGFALGGLAIYLSIPSIRHAFNRRIRVAPRYALAMLFWNESLFISRQYVRSVALALGPVALVSVLDGARIFLGIVVGWGLTQLAPAIFHENISREGLRRKAAFSLVLFVGIACISLFATG